MCPRLLKAASQEIALAQCREPNRRVASAHVGLLCHRLFQQWERLGKTPGQRIREAQGRRTLGQPVEIMPPLAACETLLQKGDGMLEHPSGEIHPPRLTEAAH